MDITDLEPKDILTENYLSLFKQFENLYYGPDVFSVDKKINGQYYSLEISRYILFIGITMKHLDESLTFIKNNIISAFPWLKDKIENALLESFANSQSATLLKSVTNIAMNYPRISSDCFLVKIEVAEKFFHMDVIEHGEAFDYVEHYHKRSEAFKEMEKKSNELTSFENLSDHTMKLFIDGEGVIQNHRSHGLGLNYIETAADGDFFISTHKFKDRKHSNYCKVIRFRLENDEI